jgi:hypothetical protein
MHTYISLLKIITVYQISFSPFLPRIIKRKNLFSKDQKKLYGLIWKIGKLKTEMIFKYKRLILKYFLRRFLWMVTM